MLVVGRRYGRPELLRFQEPPVLRPGDEDVAHRLPLGILAAEIEVPVAVGRDLPMQGQGVDLVPQIARLPPCASLPFGRPEVLALGLGPAQLERPRGEEEDPLSVRSDEGAIVPVFDEAEGRRAGRPPNAVRPLHREDLIGELVRAGRGVGARPVGFPAVRREDDAAVDHVLGRHDVQGEHPWLGAGFGLPQIRTLEAGEFPAGDVGPSGFKQIGDLRFLKRRGDVVGAQARERPVVDIRAMGQQDRRDLGMALFRGRVQRGPAHLVLPAHVEAEPDERFDDRGGASGRGQMGQAPAVLVIGHLEALLEHQVHQAFEAVRTGGKEELVGFRAGLDGDGRAFVAQHPGDVLPAEFEGEGERFHVPHRGRIDVGAPVDERLGDRGDPASDGVRQGSRPGAVLHVHVRAAGEEVLRDLDLPLLDGQDQRRLLIAIPGLEDLGIGLDDGLDLGQVPGCRRLEDILRTGKSGGEQKPRTDRRQRKLSFRHFAPFVA